MGLAIKGVQQKRRLEPPISFFFVKKEKGKKLGVEEVLFCLKEERRCREGSKKGKR